MNEDTLEIMEDDVEENRESYTAMAEAESVANEANTHYEVWKTPTVLIHDDPWCEIGIYPTGELMGVESTHDAAQARIDDLEEVSPSARFGETMDDAPYRFRIYERHVGE